tara:strand:+ start:233 stop:673 length:441 start_codon:yes stop_codon:yes gene_type:complete
MKGQILETIIGAFVILSAGWFVFSVITKTENIFPRESENTYFASFYDVSGVKVGTQIKLAGVNIGKVVGVSLDTNEYVAEVTLAINNNIKIPDDSEIIIASESLLGGNFVSITPGGSEVYLEPNEKFVYSQGSINLNSLIQKFTGN